jgi:DnaJ family protein A protein 2
MPLTDPYDTLGVDPKASADEIKKAFRKKAIKHHPDKGGDSETFNAVALAYHVIGHADRRAEFDTRGEYREAHSTDRSACNMISRMMVDILAKPSCIYTDIVSEMKQRMGETIREGRAKFSGCQAERAKNIAHLRECKSRIHVKPGGVPVMIAFVEQSIETEERQLVLERMESEDCERDCKRAIEILNGCSFERKERDPGRRPSNWTDEMLEQYPPHLKHMFEKITMEAGYGVPTR